MKNKIKPAQYDPYNLLSNSGNISIDSGVDYFAINLSQEMSGDFNITGSLKVNQFNVLSPHISNELISSSFENGCRIMAGLDNTVSGIDCCVVVGYNNNVSGQRNVVLFGDSVNLDAQNSVAIGNNISINHNGAAVFSDSTANPKISYAPDSLNIEYTGGAFIRSTSYFSEDIFTDSNLTVTGSISGLSLIINDNAKFLSPVTFEDSAIITGSLSISGSAEINGTTQLKSTFISGIRAATQFDIETYSGFVTGTYNTIAAFNSYTGTNYSNLTGLNYSISQALTTGSFYTYTGSTLQTQAVTLRTDQNISGIKSFKNRSEFCDGFMIPGSNNCDRYVPATANSTGTWGHITYSGNYLYVATGTNQWGRVQLSTW